MERYDVIVALDCDPRRALEVAEQLKDYVWGFKINSAFYHQEGGPEFVAALKRCGQLFCDFKFDDIPATVGNSVENTVTLGADLVSVHASIGEAGLREAFERGGDRVVAITQLTSDPDSSQVLPRAQLAYSVGIKNIVCSAQEAEAVRAVAPDATIITPGIRGPEDALNDQARTATPEEAFAAGANLLVVGRPILDAEDPVAALHKLMGEKA